MTFLDPKVLISSLQPVSKLDCPLDVDQETDSTFPTLPFTNPLIVGLDNVHPVAGFTLPFVLVEGPQDLVAQAPAAGIHMPELPAFPTSLPAPRRPGRSTKKQPESKGPAPAFRSPPEPGSTAQRGGPAMLCARRGHRPSARPHPPGG